MDMDFEGLTNHDLDEAIAFMRRANPFSQHTWGWDTGRFIDFRWGGNILRDAAEPGFFERHGALVRRGDDLVALVLSERGAKDHCVLTGGEDPEALSWAVRWLLGSSLRGLTPLCPPWRVPWQDS